MGPRLDLGLLVVILREELALYSLHNNVDDLDVELLNAFCALGMRHDNGYVSERER